MIHFLKRLYCWWLGHRLEPTDVWKPQGSKWVRCWGCPRCGKVFEK